LIVTVDSARRPLLALNQKAATSAEFMTVEQTVPQG